MASQFGRGAIRSWNQFHKRDNLLVSLDGSADHRRSKNRWMAVEHRFDLSRIYVEPETNDQLLRTAYDKQVLVFEPREITRVEPSFRINRGCSFLWSPVIALHHIRTAHPQFADFAIGHRIAVGTDQLHFNPRQYAAYRNIRVRGFWPCLGNRGRALRYAVSIVEHQTEKTF